MVPEASRHRGIGGRAKSADQAFFATLLEQRDLNRRCSWIWSSDTPHQLFDSFPTEVVLESQNAASGKEDRTYRGAGYLSSQGTAPHDKKSLTAHLLKALIGSLDGGCHEDSTNGKAQAEIYCSK